MFGSMMDWYGGGVGADEAVEGGGEEYVGELVWVGEGEGG